VQLPLRSGVQSLAVMKLDFPEAANHERRKRVKPAIRAGESRLLGEAREY
jgi:hypothetical protein